MLVINIFFASLISSLQLLMYVTDTSSVLLMFLSDNGARIASSSLKFRNGCLRAWLDK